MELKREYQKNNDGNVIYSNDKGKSLIRIISHEGTNYHDLNGKLVCAVPEAPTGYAPRVVGVTFKKLPTNGKVNFSTRLVEEALWQGWMTRVENALVIVDIATGERYSFHIDKEPGRYCLHCEEKLKDDGTGALARIHVTTKHGGKPTNDINDNSGYVCNNHYVTTLEK
jgi:hypothetical protein